MARAGYLTETLEQHGRRRKHYSLTGSGRVALDEWLHVYTPEPFVLRDLALLKLFFGADAAALAEGQLATLRPQLAEHEALAAHDPGDQPRMPSRALGGAQARHSPPPRDDRLLGRTGADQGLTGPPICVPVEGFAAADATRA